VTVEAITALLVAVTGLIGALVALAVQVRAYHQQVNSRMNELLELTRTSAHAEGVLAGADIPPAETAAGDATQPA
jgi:hypothetical protein